MAGSRVLGLLGVLVVLGAGLLWGASWATEPQADAPAGAASGDPRRQAEDPMVAELREALGDPSVDFPGGIRLPDRPVPPPTGSRSDEAAALADGFGPAEAAHVWRCAWEVELLEAVEASDEVRVQAVAEELRGFYELEVVERHVRDPGRRWYSDVVATAAEGDVEPLREDLTWNCHPDFRAG